MQQTETDCCIDCSKIEQPCGSFKLTSDQNSNSNSAPHDEWPDERPDSSTQPPSTAQSDEAPEHAGAQTGQLLEDARPQPSSIPETIPEHRLSKLDVQFRRVLVAANPRSGSQSRAALLDRLKRRLEEDRWEVIIETDIHRLQERIRNHQDSPELDLIIAAGGDGTAAMLASQIGPETPLALFPLGTENLLAKQLRIRAIPRFTRKMLRGGHCLDVDVGLANDKVFLLHATVGFDADVVRRLHSQRSGHIRHWSYFAPILKSIQTYQYPPMKISTASDRRPYHARWAFVFNLPAYAMGLPIVTDASATDGMFDICTFRGGSFWKGILYLGGVLLRQHRTWRDTHLERTPWIKIEADEEIPFQIDGDPGGTLPLTISFREQPLRLVIPESIVGNQISKSC